MLKERRLYTKAGTYVATVQLLPGFEERPVITWNGRFFLRDPAGNMREASVAAAVGTTFEPEVVNLGESCESF